MSSSEYTPSEILEKIKLHMKYDVSKTLNENTQLLKEDTWDYWKEITKKIMKKPNQEVASKIKGKTTLDDEKVKQVCKNIKDIVSPSETFGINFDKSQEKEDLLYNIGKSFTTLGDAILIFKKYPSIGGESLYDALDEEWSMSDVLDGIIDNVSNQIKLWCSSNPKVGFCKEKTEQEFKFNI
jgi:hypothetical protein